MTNLKDINLDRMSDAELLDLLRLTEAWSSNKEGRFDVYAPNPIMAEFHRSPAKTRVLFGGNRSGKTYSLMNEASATFQGASDSTIAQFMPKHRLDPKDRVRLCTVDYPNNFAKVIWPYIQQLVPSDTIVDVVKDSGRIRAITNRYGGFLEFMVYESEVSKFQGASRHRVLYDEQPPQEIRDENLMRLVDTDGEEVFALTPIEEANYGQTAPWLNDELFTKAAYVTEKIGDEIITTENPEGDKQIHVFFANIYDNKAINKEAAERLLSRFTPEEREVRTTGHLLFLSGLVYKEYRDNVHLIDPFDDWWAGGDANDYTLYIAIDPHPRTPHNVLFLCVRRDGLLFIVDELFVTAESAKELVDMIQATQRGKAANAIIIDPLAYTRDPRDGSCFASDLIKAGLYPMPLVASKDKARGILKVREAFGARTGADLKAPYLSVNRQLKNFRYEITHYVWDSYKKSTASSKGLKQTPIDKADHAMENLYRLLLLNPYWSEVREVKPTYRQYMPAHAMGRSEITGY